VTDTRVREGQAWPRRLEWALLAVIVLAAAFLRLYRLDSVPPGLTHDEADTGHFVVSVYRGAPSQVEAPYGYANEPLTMFTGAAFMQLFGPTDLALRLHSAFFGLLLIVFGYLWARAAFGAATGLATVALTAVSFWCVATSRFALNPQPAPTLFTGAMWALWLGLYGKQPPRARWWAWLLFALFLGASLWAYEVARATTAAVVFFGGLLAFTDRPRLRERGGWFAAAFLLGIALAAPHLLDPAAWQRSTTLATTWRALKAGDPGPMLKTVVEALGTFTFRGDPFITYNIPGLPIFNPLVGALFYGGVGLCLVRWRQPAYAFALLWTATGLLPSMVVGAWNSTLHSMGMQPVVFVLPGLAAVTASRWLGQRAGRWAARLAGVIFVGIVLLTGAYTARDYFHRWAQSPDVRAAYLQNLASITRYLEDVDTSGSVALSSPFPDLPHDPFIVDLRVHRDDLRLSWFDARGAIVLPAEATGLLIAPSGAALDSLFSERLSLELLERVQLRPDDLAPYFDIYRWQPEHALAQLLPASPGPIGAAGQEVVLPVDFGGAAELISFEVLDSRIVADEPLNVITAWRVLDPQVLGPVPADAYGIHAAIFVQLLDASDQVVAQDDRLDAPAWAWQTGEEFVQIHRLTVIDDLPPGTYRLALGLYVPSSGRRMPVLVDGVPVSDTVFLPSVEVVRP